MNCDKKSILWFLSLNSEVDKEFIEQVKKEPKVILENKGSDLAKTAYNKAMEVGKEIHAFKGFLRFDVSSHGILHTDVKLKHKVEPVLLRFFSKRFPSFTIMISSPKGIFVKMPRFQTIKFYADFSKGDILRSLEEKLPKREELSFDLDANKLWKEFYSSQYISERENKRLFNKTIPKKYRKNSLINDQNLLMKRLDEF